MSTWFIVNGAAGGGACGKRAHKVIEALRDTFTDAEIAWTDGPGHATELARDARDDGATAIVSVGGDGTAFEVLNGLFPHDDDAVLPALGYLPLGTGNSFVRDFDITDTDSALVALRSERRRRVDVVRADHDDGVFHFVNLCSLGFTATAGDLTNRRFKGMGAAGYIAATLITLARLEHPVFPVRLDDGDWDRRPCALLSFSNSGYTAGTMNMAPGADPADGRVDVVRVGALGRGRFLATFPKIFAGTHTQARDIEQTTAATVDLDLPGPVDCMVDGEIIRARPTRLTVLHHALEVLL
jgi:YegS/Rv2252/BmrU family lipid kinase